MSGYNEAKYEILETVLGLGSATTNEIAELTGKRYENVSILCLQYYRYGLLGRKRLEGTRAYAYFITQRGVERLDWLNRDEFE